MSRSPTRRTGGAALAIRMRHLAARQHADQQLDTRGELTPSVLRAYSRLMPSTLDSLLAALGAPTPPEGNDRDRVLVHARAAFLDFGIRRTSMAEIGKRSGLSPATLYRWYQGKDDVVRGVLLREVRDTLAAIEEGLEGCETVEAELTERTVRAARALRQPPLLKRLLETDPDLVLPQLTEHAGPLIEAATLYLQSHIERLAAEGRIGNVDAAALAELLVRVAHSLALTPSTTGFLGSDDRVRATIADVFRRLLQLPLP